MKNTNIKIMIITLGLFSLMGCKPPAKEGARAYTTTTRNDLVNGNGNGSIFQGQCPSGQSTIGTIYDASSNFSPTFEQNIKGFLSATTAPSDVGTISSASNDVSTGVRFQVAIKLDQSGQVVLASSKVSIKVYDSYFLNQGFDPITVAINTASAGQFNLQTGAGSVSFKDNYGEVRFEGKVVNGYLVGNASYTNYATVVTNASPSTGPLGQFAVLTCAAIQ
ncbi:MAG: hypothetical protein H7235_00675 [Bdellovibrionaceae bacterium]|nr:hypothetical protein [Pseudobdellovibrionaceae bacterium]